MTSFYDYLENSSQYTVRHTAEIAASESLRDRRLLSSVPFNINRIVKKIDSVTRRWIKSDADERAVHEHKCIFSEEIGLYVVNWIEDNCVLYEGDKAGDPMEVDDWQYEMYMQGFGWQFFDEEWEIRRAGAGWVRRYKTISGWIPKKNAKSPTLAATGIYLFAGDGEQGQKCFSLATTRDQALISHTHALNFVRQSPSLLSHCRINATDASITDAWTNSTYTILCGDKGGLKKSKEGINGSLIIDETHVVDDAFMHVIDRAGISRRQPMKIQLSTSGEDTAGYGFQQYTLGQQNLKAASENRPFNFRFYHFEFSIPQDTSFDDIRNPDKIDALIRMANPTIGRIVRFTEAKEDWQNSLRSDTALAKFSMYRLNQWNTGGGAFLAGSDWKRCVRHFSHEDVKDHPLVLGVDMSRIRDMTAVVAIWAVPKVVYLPENIFDPDSPLTEREINVPHVMPFFWVPQATIDQYSGHIDIRTMAQKGQLKVTTSRTIKPEIISEFIAYLDKRYDCRGVASDMAYSRALSASLSAVHGWNVDGDNSKFFLIPQTASGIGPAVEQLQGCVLEQELVHNDNLVMNWQLGNIKVIEDNNNNRRFAKPSTDDYRKIDGWAALANGFFLMMNNPDLYPGSPLSIKMGV